MPPLPFEAALFPPVFRPFFSLILSFLYFIIFLSKSTVLSKNSDKENGKKLVEKVKMDNRKRVVTYFCLGIVSFYGCMSAGIHQRSLGSTAEREMTVGLVQKEIRAGMSQADVVTALGSPNIVTRDGEGNETWVYDKIAKEASYSRSGAYGSILVLGFNKEAGAVSSTERTLTVIIKFDEKNLVKSFSYHSSKF